MDVLQAILLGLLQGLTEFLPISSSGHLVLARNLLDQPLMQGVTFEVVVHFGTLCSIVVYYASDIAKLFKSAFRAIGKPTQVGSQFKADSDLRMVVFILWSMIPALIIGLTLEDYIESHLMTTTSVGIMLLVTGMLLMATNWLSKENRNLGWGNSLGVGLAQAFAILPGVSRSGSTISMGLFLGLPRDQIANFSFLMVIPVIAGAMLLKIFEMMETGISLDAVWVLVAGFFTAFISGYFALVYLIKILKSGGIYWFAIYCWLIGLLALILG